MYKLRFLSLSLLLPLAISCASSEELPELGDLGKADTASVAAALADATRDGELSADDVDSLFDATGRAVSKNEMLSIRDAVESTSFTVTDEAAKRALEQAYVANLLDHEAAQLSDPTVGYGGSKIPEAVRAFVAQARLNGAVAFDARDDAWTHYPATTPPVDNMDFDYTIVTPEGLAADVADTSLVYNAIVGTETAEQCDNAGNCQEYEQARYEERTGGSGNIAAHYDEVHHPDLMARGSRNQKWASNCAFLSDGSVHCLPAARRSFLRDLILTNPSLSRCSRSRGLEEACHSLLYMGHITASAGVITGVEVSGRVSRRIGSGRSNLIDPIALLDAWGFERSPNLRVRFGNTSDGTPQTNADRGVLEGQ